MIKNLIFDFDGTLADSLDLALDFGNQNWEKYSGRTITREEFRERSMREALQFIGLPMYRLPKFVMDLKAHMKAHVQSVSLFPEIPSMVRELSKKGFELYVLSSNSRENIRKVLERHQIEELFKDIFSDSSIFGKHVVIDRSLKRSGLSREETLYIGDEIRDAEACRKSRVKMLAVSWGWDSRERLSVIEDLKIADSAAELMGLIQE